MVIPIMRIFDQEKAKAFYIDFLGFTYDWEHQFEADFPVYCQISLEGIRIHLTEHHGDCSPGAAVRIPVTNIQAFHAALPRDYPFAKPGIEQAPWGTEEVTVTDPFYNRLVFYEEMER